MNKSMALTLNEWAEIIAKRYSNAEREFNHNSETFEVGKITPLSESTAVVEYIKSSGKKALAFFYYVNGNGGVWNYFFPSDSHVIGMEKVGEYLTDIEEFNFRLNFENDIKL